MLRGGVPGERIGGLVRRCGLGLWFTPPGRPPRPPEPVFRCPGLESIPKVVAGLKVGHTRRQKKSDRWESASSGGLSTRVETGTLVTCNRTASMASGPWATKSQFTGCRGQNPVIPSPLLAKTGFPLLHLPCKEYGPPSTGLPVQPVGRVSRICSSSLPGMSARPVLVMRSPRLPI